MSRKCGTDILVCVFFEEAESEADRNVCLTLTFWSQTREMKKRSLVIWMAMGVDVHAVEAVFDEVELAAVVVVVVGEGAFEFLAHWGGVELGELGLLPPLVVGIKFAENVNELVEDAHREGP